MYLADVAVKCPSCGAKFSSKQVPVWVDVGVRNSELRQDFGGKAPQPESYAVCTCPNCGSSDWMSRFPISEEEAVLNQPTLTAHLQFHHAAVAAERNDRDFYNGGMLFLYAAWSADDSNALPQAREYRRLAAHAFTRSLMDVSCPVARRAEIEYLIGELLRRSGQFEAAKDHLRQVIPRLPGRFAYMARKILRLAEQGDTFAIEFEFDPK